LTELLSKQINKQTNKETNEQKQKNKQIKRSEMKPNDTCYYQIKTNKTFKCVNLPKNIILYYLFQLDITMLQMNEIV
jgi:hypothetical protein